MNFGLASDFPPSKPGPPRCQINFQPRQSKLSLNWSQANISQAVVHPQDQWFALAVLGISEALAGALALGMQYGLHEFKSSFLRTREGTAWRSGLSFLTRRVRILRIFAHNPCPERTALPTARGVSTRHMANFAFRLGAFHRERVSNKQQ